MATLTVPDPAPSPAEDAENIRKAVDRWGTDEKALIDILAHRDAAQRKHIQLTYEEKYKESLTKRLESELSGNFERAVYRWNFDPIERQAILAYLALKKQFNCFVIIEVALANSPKELLLVKEAYQAKYKHSLEEDVAADSTGDLRKLLVALISPYRYSGEEVDARLAKSEAKILGELIKKNELNNEEITRIVGTRSRAQLIATFNCYREEFGTSIQESLAGVNSNELAEPLRWAIECIVDPPLYFVEVLQNALNKTDEDTLTRVIVMHAEKDLAEIKEKFHKCKNAALEHLVTKKTFGDYKAFLLALLGN